jgi:hypothetical protein
VAGRYTGGQRLALVVFRVAPGKTERIPLLVGTSSYDPALGYAVPPGRWALFAVLRLEDGRRLKTPLLGVTVVSRRGSSNV